MSEEAANPDRDVPRAINFVLVTVLVVYLGISLIALSAMPVKPNVLRRRPRDRPDGAGRGRRQERGRAQRALRLQGHAAAGQRRQRRLRAGRGGGRHVGHPGAETPPRRRSRRDGVRRTRGCTAPSWAASTRRTRCVGIVRFLPDDLGWLKAILMPWVGILAATILLIATNAGLIGVSRLAYSLGQHRQVPPILGRVHPKRLTPYVSIIVFGVVACLLLLLPGSTISLLADLYAFGAMISFTVAHVSVVGCGIKEPDTAAAVPHAAQHPVRGKMSVPVLAVIGGLGTFTVWCVVVATHPVGPHSSASSGWASASSCTSSTARPRATRSRRRVDKVVVPDQHAGRHRLRPDPRAHHRLAHQRRDDGARLPAGDREEVGHRRPVRDRGAAQPAARRPPRQRARQGRQGAQGRRRSSPRSSRSSSRRTWSRRARPAGRSSRRRPCAAARSSCSARRASGASAT